MSPSEGIVDGEDMACRWLRFRSINRKRSLIVRRREDFESGLKKSKRMFSKCICGIAVCRICVHEQSTRNSNIQLIKYACMLSK